MSKLIAVARLLPMFINWLPLAASSLTRVTTRSAPTSSAVEFQQVLSHQHNHRSACSFPRPRSRQIRSLDWTVFESWVAFARAWPIPETEHLTLGFASLVTPKRSSRLTSKKMPTAKSVGATTALRKKIAKVLFYVLWVRAQCVLSLYVATASKEHNMKSGRLLFQH